MLRSVALVRTDVLEKQHKLQLATDARCVRRLLVAASVVPSSPILVTLMEALPHGVTSQKTIILHSHRCENLKSYIFQHIFTTSFSPKLNQQCVKYSSYLAIF
jgi:hypothetical protein